MFVPLQKVVQNRKVVQLSKIVMANTNLKEAKAAKNDEQILGSAELKSL